MTKRKERRPKWRPHFKVGHRWLSLDSPLFYKKQAAANWAGRFYLVLRWTIKREAGR